MQTLIGKTLIISGMQIQVLSDTGAQYRTRNVTTGEPILFDKQQLDTAIRLGKAEPVEDQAGASDTQPSPDQPH